MQLKFFPFDDKKQFITYLIVLLVSVVYIVVGHRIAISDYHAFAGDDTSIVVKATVAEITDRYVNTYPISDYEIAEDTVIVFQAEIKSGALKGQTIEAAQSLDYFTAVHLREVAPGDQILLYTIPGGMAEHEWLMSDYQRFDQIAILTVLFLVMVLVMGRWQGFNTIVSLSLTCLAIFYVFIPAVLAGESIYLWSIVTCIYVTIMTLFVVNGINRKSIAAILGCLAGIMLAGILTVYMDNSMQLTGIVDENSVLLYGLRPENPFLFLYILFSWISKRNI